MGGTTVVVSSPACGDERKEGREEGSHRKRYTRSGGGWGENNLSRENCLLPMAPVLGAAFI